MLLKLKDGSSSPLSPSQNTQLTNPTQPVECGPGFTQKLEIMFKDVELSSDFARVYAASRPSTSSSSPFDLSVNVLSMGNWPSYPASNVRLPDAMTRALDRFRDFYVSKHSGRSLSWQHSLDHCAVKATFPKGGKKELAVSLFQALVLLLFNDVPEGGALSFEDIVADTRLGAFFFWLCGFSLVEWRLMDGMSTCRCEGGESDAAVVGVRQGARAAEVAEGSRGRAWRHVQLQQCSSFSYPFLLSVTYLVGALSNRSLRTTTSRSGSTRSSKRRRCVASPLNIHSRLKHTTMLSLSPFSGGGEQVDDRPSLHRSRLAPPARHRPVRRSSFPSLLRRSADLPCLYFTGS